MKIINKRLKLIVSGILLCHAWAYTQSVEMKLQKMLDSVFIANPASVGLMAHVESPDQNISWSGSSGYFSKNSKKSLDPDQPALIASNIKTYVSATILRLAEEGKLSIHQSIRGLLTDKTRVLFEEGGYNLGAIKIKHLLSHTSGIQNYANQDYIDFIDENKNYRWTRDEQLELTIKTGAPVAMPEKAFNYSDANYLLLTEIIENITKKPFYTSMRELLRYESSGFDNTWIPTLEEKPDETKSLVHQYWSEYNWDSYEIDVSVDLYGGGGIACTTKDLAGFLYKLFNGKIVEDTTVLHSIYTDIPTKDSIQSNYYLGISSNEFEGFKAYGHSGFWGTIGFFFPDLNTSISIYVLERDKRKLRSDIIDQIVLILIADESGK